MPIPKVKTDKTKSQKEVVFCCSSALWPFFLICNLLTWLTFLKCIGSSAKDNMGTNQHYPAGWLDFLSSLQVLGFIHRLKLIEHHVGPLTRKQFLCTSPGHWEFRASSLPISLILEKPKVAHTRKRQSHGIYVCFKKRRGQCGWQQLGHRSLARCDQWKRIMGSESWNPELFKCSSSGGLSLASYRGRHQKRTAGKLKNDCPNCQPPHCWSLRNSQHILLLPQLLGHCSWRPPLRRKLSSLGDPVVRQPLSLSLVSFSICVYVCVWCIWVYVCEHMCTVGGVACEGLSLRTDLTLTPLYLFTVAGTLKPAAYWYGGSH